MDAIQIHEQPANMSWEAQEVVREVNRRPHLLVRLTLRGATFPHRAMVPFVRVVLNKNLSVRAWFSEIAGDSDALHGYFVTDLPGRGRIEFGYGNQVLGSLAIPFARKAVVRLDPKRLAGDVVKTTREYLDKLPG